ncbi:MAG: AAA family ATPase [Planctomycetia bacterium]|nr:AAA family ATPase [Planctomycetia bacterium]
MPEPADFVNTPDPQKRNPRTPNPSSSPVPDLAGAGTDGASLVSERCRLRLEYEDLYGGSDEWETNRVAVLEEPEPPAPDAPAAPQRDEVKAETVAKVQSTASECNGDQVNATESLGDPSPTKDAESGEGMAFLRGNSREPATCPDQARPVTPRPITLVDGTVINVPDPKAPLRLRDHPAWRKSMTQAEQVLIHSLRLPPLFQEAERLGLGPSFLPHHRHFFEVWEQACKLVERYGIPIMGSDWRGMLEQWVQLRHAEEPALDPEQTLARASLFQENEASDFTGSFFDRVFTPPPDALSLDTGRQLVREFIFKERFRNKVEESLQRNKDMGSLLTSLGKLVQEGQTLVQDTPPPFMTPDVFAQTEFKLDWLVRNVLVAGQPAIVGGPSKAMKTSVMIDLAVSIGAGGDAKFLGRFPVGQPGKHVGFISAESGGATIKETFQRVCQARGVTLAKCNVYPEFRLPKLSQSAEVSSLVAAVKRHGLQVLVIDPIYLSLLAGDQDRRQPRQASNVFDMGPLLGDLSQAFQEAGCTLILVHHTVKHLPGAVSDRFEPLDREHLAMAGFAEFARQWLLINRRERYEDGTGMHKLHLRLGGSAGFGSLWAVDIDEGVIDENFCGRQWKVQVRTASELKDIEHQAVERQQQQKQKARQELDEMQILGVLKAIPAGETATEIRKAAGISNSRSIMPILHKLCQEGKIEPIKIKKQGGRGLHEVDAYRLKHAAMLAGSNEEPPQEEGAEQ